MLRLPQLEIEIIKLQKNSIQRVEKVDTLARNTCISCISQNLRARLCLAT